MSVSDLSSEQTGPNLHYLIHSLLICVILQIDVHVMMHVGVHSLPEVLHRDRKWLCHPNTSGLTRMMVPTQLFLWWPQLPWGTTAGTESSFCPLLLVSDRRARLQSHLIYLLWSPWCHTAWHVGQMSQTTGWLLLWDNGTINETAVTTKCCV